MKKIMLIAIAIIITNILFAQNNYYYYQNQAQYFFDDSTSINIVVKNMSNYDSIVSNLQNLFNSVGDEVIFDDEDYNIIVNSDNMTNYTKSQIINYAQQSKNDIEFFTYSKRLTNDSTQFWLNNYCLVKIYSKYSFSSIQTIVNNYSTDTVINEGGNWYAIKCNNETDLLEMSSELQQSSYVQYAAPDKYSSTQNTTSDPK